MVAKSFQVGDLVWAKMKGYPPWPGEIMAPPQTSKSPKSKKSHHYVLFFGSDNYAWIPDEMILLHDQKLIEEYGSKKKTAYFQKAVETIIEKSKDISSVRLEAEDELEAASSKVKDHESSYSLEMSPKSKSPHSNSATKKIKKKISVKKLKLKESTRKRTYSSDQSEPDSFFRREKEARYERSAYDDQYKDLLNNIPPNIDYNGGTIHSTPGGLLARNYVERPETPTLDLLDEGDTLKIKEINPTAKKIGFLGLSKLGQGIVKNLQQSGHSVTIWNRTTEKCKPFVEKLNIEIASTPADVVSASDITFCCVSDADAAKALVFGNCGVLKALESCAGENKGYVEMTSMDPKTSQAVAEEIRLRGGRYLEAPINNGSRIDAHEGKLLILTAGDKSLYEECKSCLVAASKKHKYLGPDVGIASSMHLVHTMFIGTVYAALAESLALMTRANIETKDFLEVLKEGLLDNDELIKKGKSMIENDYVSNTSLKHVQKDLNLGLMLGSSVEQPTPIIAAANEAYKHCKLLRYGDHDVSAIFEGTRP